MAMVIYNNMLATKSLGALNKNIVEKGKRMTRLATGEKINSAGDSAAEFSISERMQVQLRSLGQDIENTKTGRSMLGVAAGGIESIVEELRSMKEMAINAANDTNTDVDRATLQKEFDQRKQDIADIVSSTNYNGKLLLDGTYARKHLKVDTNTVTEETDSELGARGAQGAVTRAFTGTERTWPTDSQVVNGVTTVTLSEAGAYTIPDGFTGTIQVSSAAAAAGVKLSQAGSSLSNVNINVENGGSGANLWIDGLNITNNRDDSIIQFSGSGNTLTLLGSSTLNFSSGAALAAVVDMGDSLTLQGNGSSLSITRDRSSNGACIGTDAMSNVTSGNLTVIDANLDLHSGTGAAIGAGTRAGMGDILVENSTVTMTGGTFSGIGSGYSSASCGDIVVRQSTIIDTHSVDTCIGSGFSNCSCGDITVENCIVQANNSDSAIIGAGDANGRCGTITVSNTDIESTSNHGAAVGSGRNAHAGDVYIKNATKIKHSSRDGAAIGSGLNGSVGVIHISTSSLDLLDASQAYIAADHVIPGIGHGRNGSASDTAGLTKMADDAETSETEDEKYVDGTPLIVHTGTKANQQMRCYIENLGLEALGIADAELTTQAKATHLLGNPHNPAVEGVLDKAINYVLGEATQVGAYMSRLEKTRDNLTTNQENTNSAESTIRDADMAKEMTEYTKSNVLTQAAQAMLAQANQNSGSVLNLLQ